MDLSTLKRKSAPRAEFVYDQDMTVTLSYVSPARVREMVGRSKVMSGGFERLDDDKYLAEFAAAIEDWKGFTLGRVAVMLDIDVPPGDENKTVPCNAENKLALLRDAWRFRPWVEEKCRELSGFLEAERKNSSSSPSGNSSAA